MNCEAPLDERLAEIQRRLEQARLDLLLLQAAVCSTQVMPPPSETLTEAPLPSAIPARPSPAVRIEESISPDGQFIYCLIDGKKLQMLRKYLRRFGHTPSSYRAAFGLPPDYPMTAPGYSARKRREAYRVGLGTRPNRSGSRPHAHAGSARQAQGPKVA